MPKIINYSFLTSNVLNVDHPECLKHIITDDYIPCHSLSRDIISSRKGATYLKCPAHTDFLKNTFVFSAPFDLNIEIEIDKKSNSAKIYCDNIIQEIYESIIDTRFIVDSANNKNRYPILGIDWLTVFKSDESCLVQMMPAFMHRNEFTEKTTIIPGEYDISKWTRPIETVFEIRSDSERIEIKKGDALAYIKFNVDDFVKLVKAETPWSEIITCNDIRNADKFRPLSERYQALEKQRANKCPFDHDKKGP